MRLTRRKELRAYVRRYCADLIEGMETNGDGAYQVACSDAEERLVTEQYRKVAELIRRSL